MGRISIRDLIRTVEVPDEVERYVLDLRQEAESSGGLLREAADLLRARATVEYVTHKKPAKDIIALLDRIDAHFEE